MLLEGKFGRLIVTANVEVGHSHMPPLVAPPLKRPFIIDDAGLLRAIQTLDKVNDSTNHPVEIARLFRAWAFFLNLTNALEGDQSETARHQLALVLEVRVLSCVTRFLMGRSRRQAANEEDNRELVTRLTWRESACVQHPTKRCLVDVMHTVACCFLFQLSRYPSTAMLVMRSGVYRFLMAECRGGRELASIPVGVSPSGHPLCDARDLTIAVDAFDWPTQALYTTLKREGDVSHAFVVPIGARSIAHVLQDHPLPTNEAEEYGLMQSPLSPTPLARTSDPDQLRKVRPRPRRLPSMFSFPTNVREADIEASVVCSVCCPRFNPVAWSIMQRGSTSLYFATRAIVLLALHLPLTSPEGKKLRQDGVLNVLQLVSTRTHSTSGTVDSLAGEDAKSRTTSDTSEVNDDGEWRVIRMMASVGQRLLDSGTGRDPPTSSPGSPRPKIVSKSTGSVLGDKLQAITKQMRYDASQQKQRELARVSDAEQTVRRSRVLDAYTNAMATRVHLLQSLAVLCAGRVHPAADNQTITDWLSSFLTLEKKEQQRHEQEAVRQRRLLEQQYQFDERRRRERAERMIMELNDHDTLDSFAAQRAEAKREAFARLQVEMKAMQTTEATDAEEATVVLKRDAAREEARRLHLLADDRRRQTLEETMMKKEDHYYADKILREKRQREAQARQEKVSDPIAQQQKQIERMRRLDEEKKRSEQEIHQMRSEDLLARQRRFVDAEIGKKQLDRERQARKHMEREEQWMRIRWKQIEDALQNLQHAEEKQQRAEARREKRLREQQTQQWQQWHAAWVACYDTVGNLYYYNQITGESQWENPRA